MGLQHLNEVVQSAKVEDLRRKFILNIDDSFGNVVQLIARRFAQ